MIENQMLFPIYEADIMSFRFKKNATGQDLHTFQVPNFTLPSFFFTRPKSDGYIAEFKVRDLQGNVVASIPLSYLHMGGSADYDYIGYVSKVIKRIEDEVSDGYDNYLLPCGFYYITLLENNEEGSFYASEIFEAVDVVAIPDHEKEYVVNGDFRGNDMLNWSTNGTWSAATTVAVYSGGGGGVILKQTLGTFADTTHFYRIMFTVTGFNATPGGAYLRIYTNGLDGVQSVKVTANGSYVYYVEKLSDFLIQQFGGGVTFAIDDISIQRIAGYLDKVSLILAKDCKFPNSIDHDNHFYYNLLLFKTDLLEPEYGEEQTTDENGSIEKVISFVRAFKKWTFNTLLVPEPLADALAQLNTFDIAEIFNGNDVRKFVLNTTEPGYKRKGIHTFDAKIAWQEGDLYALADVSFEENLSIKDKCCDSNPELLPCADLGQTININITSDGDNTHFHITLANTPVGMEGCFVKLYLGKVANADFVSCFDSMTIFGFTGQMKSWADFVAEGFTFYAPDMAAYAFGFKLSIRQFGCAGEADPPATCITPLQILSGAADGNCVGGDNTIGFNLRIIGFTGVTLEFWNSNTNAWVYPQTPVTAGAVVGSVTFGDDYQYITKARLREPGGVLSPEFDITVRDCTCQVPAPFTDGADIRWDDNIGICEFDYEVASDSGFVTVVDSGHLTGTSYDTTAHSLAAGTYYFRVKSSSGHTAWSSTVMFTI